AYKRVKSKPSSIIEPDHKNYAVKCVICRKAGDLADYYRLTTCLRHAMNLQVWVNAAREVYRVRGNEGLIEFSKKVEEAAGEFLGRSSSIIELEHKPSSSNNQSLEHKDEN
ncbi:MAG: hypothetical protein ACK4TI_01035, partial [Nitrososphaerales archaeon]